MSRFHNDRCPCGRGPAVFKDGHGYGQCIECQALEDRNAALRAKVEARQRKRRQIVARWGAVRMAMALPPEWA
jgi:hypothetical protein